MSLNPCSSRAGRSGYDGKSELLSSAPRPTNYRAWTPRARTVVIPTRLTRAATASLESPSLRWRWCSAIAPVFSPAKTPSASPAMTCRRTAAHGTKPPCSFIRPPTAAPVGPSKASIALSMAGTAPGTSTCENSACARRLFASFQASSSPTAPARSCPSTIRRYTHDQQCSTPPASTGPNRSV